MGQANRDIRKMVIMLLWAGLALGLSRSPRQSFKIITEVSNELCGIREDNLKRTIKDLYKLGILKEIRNKNGTIKIVLSDAGNGMAMYYSLDDLIIVKPKEWDGNWRIVMFDIPERFKKVRDEIRMHLKSLGFYELQKSVFVHPFPCAGEVDKIIKFYNAREYVRIITANSIDIGKKIIKHYSLG